MAVLKYYDTGTSSWQYIAASTTANFTTWKKTVAGGETSVSGTDDNAVTLSYTVGLEQVFINGVLQVRGSDYTATTGTSITGLSALAANDVVTVICYAPFNVANTIAPTLVDAKGDLIAGTAADTVGRLAVGTNDYVLTAASGETTGLKWAQPKVVQIVNVTYNTEAASTSNAYVDTGLSASITPTSSSNKVLVLVTHGGVAKFTNNTWGQYKLMRGASDLITFETQPGRNDTTATNNIGGISVNYLDSPATTSSTTYKTRFLSGQNNATVYVQLNGAYSSMTLIEVTP